MSFTKYPAPGVNSYSSVSAFPTSAGNGTLALALDTDNLYAYNQNSQMWVAIGGPDLNQVSIGDLDGTTPSVKGAVMVGDVLIMQSASTTRSGLVNTTTQSIAGAKTFTNTTESTTKDTGAIITEGGVGVEKNINAGGAIAASGAITGSNLSGTNTGNVTLAAVGAVPNANAASLSGQALTLQPADATNPGVVTTGTQAFAGNKTLTSAGPTLSLTSTGANQPALVCKAADNDTTNVIEVKDYDGITTLHVDGILGAVYAHGLISTEAWVQSPQYLTQLNVNGNDAYNVQNNAGVSWDTADTMSTKSIKLNASNVFEVSAPVSVTGNLAATTLTPGNGATGTFTTADLKTVTVTNGIITSIV